MIPAASPPLDEITTALLDLFDLSGRTRADGQGFDGDYDADPVKPAFPYWVLYSIPGGSADPMPDLDKRGDEVTAVWQLSAVSKFRNQAQQLARACHDLVVARTGPGVGWAYPIVIPAGWVCTDRTAGQPAGVVRTGQTPNAIYTAAVRFTLTICPA